jgi:serine/threonine-protein kinase HipA
MDRETLVYVDLDGAPHLIGRLWARVRKNKESATFEYDPAWLQHPARFSLEPALQLGPGPFHTAADTPMFGAIGDSAPDRWGRALMRRMERRRAERAGTAPRTLQEIDYLLLVDDEARQGALRFAEREGGPFLREEGIKRIPPLVELPELLSAAEHVMEDKDTEEDMPVADQCTFIHNRFAFKVLVARKGQRFSNALKGVGRLLLMLRPFPRCAHNRIGLVPKFCCHLPVRGHHFSR